MKKSVTILMLLFCGSGALFSQNRCYPSSKLYSKSTYYYLMVDTVKAFATFEIFLSDKSHSRMVTVDSFYNIKNSADYDGSFFYAKKVGNSYNVYNKIIKGYFRSDLWKKSDTLKLQLADAIENERYLDYEKRTIFNKEYRDLSHIMLELFLKTEKGKIDTELITEYEGIQTLSPTLCCNEYFEILDIFRKKVLFAINRKQ